MDVKVYCLDPVTIINPQLVGFILKSKTICYTGEAEWVSLRLPELKANASSAYVKRTLRKWLSWFLHKHKGITHFMNEDGEVIDVYTKVPCGHCLLCTERKKKSFAAKCIMETQMHEYLPEFVTLTYNDEHLPKDGINYRDVQLFLKRLRMNLKRSYGFDGELKYAVGSEYGSRTFRPHYHMLIWGIPRNPGQPLWHHANVDKVIKDSWQQGFVYVKTCGDSNAAYYVSKYVSKDVKIPRGSNAPVHRSSINLGVDFVMDKAAGVLRANPEYTEVKYCDRFTGKVCKIPMVKYFIDKVFPTYSSVPVEYRNALRDFHLSKGSEMTKLEVNLPLLDTEVEAFRDTEYNFPKLSAACCVLKRIEGKEYPDFAENKAKREKYYIHLFDNLGDIDLEHVAYKLKKKQAKDKDKEVF